MKKPPAGPRGESREAVRMTAEASVQIVPVGPQRISIEQALALASRHQAAGRLAEAEALLKKILQVSPGNPYALHTLGIVAHMAGKTDVAAKLVEQAIKNKGDVPLFHSNLAEMYRLLKRLDDAVESGKRAVALDPRLVAAQGNLGVAYYDRGDYDEAESCQRAALAINPKFAPSLNNMGSIMRARRDRDAAIDWYRRAVQANPEYLESLNNLGATLTEADRTEEGMAVLNQVLAKNPNYAEAHCNRGFAFLGQSKINQAFDCFQTGLRLRNDYPEAYQGIARGWQELYDLDKAEAAARKALELGPDMPEAHATLGSIYVAQGRPDLGRQCFEKAIELDPDLPSGRLGLGNILVEEGKFGEAEALFRTVVDIPGEQTSALFSMVQTKKIKPGDEIIARLESYAEKIDNLPESKAIQVHFALGKVYDDLGDADRSFPHFMKGCAIKRSKIEYDADEKDRYYEQIKTIFTRQFIDGRRGNGDPSSLPIFVLGMPRSGTTLTEQIIASHPDAFGAGELTDLMRLVNRRQHYGDDFPGSVAQMKPSEFAELGRKYAEGLRLRDPRAKHITDKLPSNFLHVGLIHLMLPNAKIVHVNRHPLDTCISCYTRLFAHNQNQTYDLYELGRFYKGYSDLMKHWRAVLPKGAFYDLQYEALTDDTEAEAKKLIAYCGLEWNDSCLAFHENKRNIRTASVHQVRQPIYKTSVARWKKYEKFLGPLIEGLGDAIVAQ